MISESSLPAVAVIIKEIRNYITDYINIAIFAFFEGVVSKTGNYVRMQY